MIEVQIGGNFQAMIDRRIEELKANVERAVMDYAITTHREIVQQTPLYSGRARAEWQMSIGGNTGGLVTGEPHKGQKDQPGSVPWETYANSAQDAIRGYQIGDQISIFNNLPYINRLNEGYSKQASAGFVEAAIGIASASLAGNYGRG
jgi:hypothetical protein